MSVLSPISNFLNRVIPKVLLLSGKSLGRRSWHLPFWRRQSRSAGSCELRHRLPRNILPGREPPGDNAKKLFESHWFSFNITFSESVHVFSFLFSFLLGVGERKMNYADSGP